MSIRNRFVHVTLGLTFLSSWAWAQSDTGVIRGTVTDASGAAVPDIHVTVSDELRSAKAFNAVADESGRYIAPALKPSTYSVSAGAPGFKRALRTGIVLDVNQTAVVDIALEVGSVTETLVVNAAAPLLQTDSAELADVVEQRRVTELPLNGRFFVNMVNLTTGVVPAFAGQPEQQHLSGGSRRAARRSGERATSGQQ